LPVNGPWLLLAPTPASNLPGITFHDSESNLLTVRHFVRTVEAFAPASDPALMNRAVVPAGARSRWICASRPPGPQGELLLWCPGVLRLPDFLEIVGLSLGVSLTATALATVISLPAGAALAIFPFPGRRLVVVVINALFGLPPVVIGLLLYLAFSRSGPLGFLQLLFTPTAMVIAQALLAIPIITALVHRAGERAWARYGDELISDGASRAQSVPQILAIIRADLLTAILAGFGRTVSEVGAVILVGGNIRGLTRTMTTAIALQTSQGDLSLALALGAVLVGISISISATVFALAGGARTAGSDEV